MYFGEYHLLYGSLMGLAPHITDPEKRQVYEVSFKADCKHVLGIHLTCHQVWVLIVSDKI